MPASTSWPWVACNAPRARWSRCASRWSLMSSRLGTAERSASSCATRSAASSGSARRSRPTRHAALRRRAGGRGSSFRRSEGGRGRAPSRSRSAATRPPTLRTMGDRAIARDDVAPTARNARFDTAAHRLDPEVLLERGERGGERLGHRSGAEHRTRGGDHLCARGHGPALEQPGGAVPPECPLDILWSAERALGRARDGRERVAPPIRERSRPATLVALDAAGPAVRARAGCPSAAHSPVRPVRRGPIRQAGDRVDHLRDRHRTARRRAQHRASAGAAPPSDGHAMSRARARTASSSAGQPTTSRSVVNMPAIDEVAPSSTVDDDRTASARRPSSVRIAHASRSSSRTSSRQPAPLVVMTRPGKTGRRSRVAAARVAALAPVSAGSVASASCSHRRRSSRLGPRTRVGCRGPCRRSMSRVRSVTTAHPLGP